MHAAQERNAVVVDDACGHRIARDEYSDAVVSWTCRPPSMRPRKPVNVTTAPRHLHPLATTMLRSTHEPEE